MGCEHGLWVQLLNSQDPPQALPASAWPQGFPTGLLLPFFLQGWGAACS